METNYFLNEAEVARLTYIDLQNKAKEYAGCKSLKVLKKDAEFIRLTKEIKQSYTLWMDYNRASLIQAKQEKIQSILN